MGMLGFAAEIFAQSCSLGQLSLIMVKSAHFTDYGLSLTLWIIYSYALFKVKNTH